MQLVHDSEVDLAVTTEINQFEKKKKKKRIDYTDWQTIY